MPESGRTIIPQHRETAQPSELLARPTHFRAGRFSFPLGRKTYIMGILNITPDSFSDGGKFFSADDSLRHAEAMLRQGADILDIGGESTKPGFLPVSLEEEHQRIVPIIELISRNFDCPISVDTYKPAIAEAALAAGACAINDINGLQQEPAMARIAASHQAGVVMMHNARLYRNNRMEQQESASVMDDVLAFLAASCCLAEQAGLGRDQLLIDPGIGFGVSPEESITMIAELSRLLELKLPILLGPSRKRFIGEILNLPAAERLHGTSAAVAIGIAHGADFVRVHDVREMAEVARVADALCRKAGKDRGLV